MKIVVDTNILFSFFWRSSLTRKLLLSPFLELISPSIALAELKKYSIDIIKKTKTTKIFFQKELSNIGSTVSFIDRKEYSAFFKEAEKISPDETDAEFFALCLKYKCFLWSNDLTLKNQNKVKVLTTEEIIRCLL